MKKYSIYVLFFLVMIAVLISQNRFRNRENNIIIRELSKEKSFFLDHPNDNPDKFAEYHKKIRTRRGEDLPGYRPGYLEKEYADAYARAKNASHRKNEYAWQERGPSNVPGRTRGIIQLPGDPDKLTWLAGSVGGGIWKTEDGGKNWVNKTPSLPNLATTSLAYSEADPDIIYAGTGESYGAGGLIEIVGQGIYKSLDGGESWSPLITSTDLFRFMAVNRIMVDPVNPDILIISANQNIGRGLSFKSGIYKSTDGGNTWDKVFEPNGWIQQVLYEPGNFTIQYAGVYGNGIAKSVDAGHSWTLITNGIFPSGRIELAVSPGNTQVLYAAVEGERSGVDSDFYISEDGGENWKLVVEQNNLANRNFFAATASSPAQGGWNNTIAVHPFYDSIIYVGGVDLWKMEMLSGEEIGERDFLGVKEEGTGDFMTFVSFNSGGYWADRLATGNLDESRFVTVEIRFGQGKRQMAHRFETPSDGGTNSDGGAGIPDADYQYQDYVEVPFEVWDIENDRQLMVSFRDQAKNGLWDLIPLSTSGNFDSQSREYFFIHDRPYSPEPDPTLTVDGGHVVSQMYFMWPHLAVGASWDDNILPESELVILWGEYIKKFRKTTRMTTWAGNETEGGRELPYVHADQHAILPLSFGPVTKDEEFRLLVANDGGVFISSKSANPGLMADDWTFAGNGFNTSQFYGVDKKPGADEFIGGLQDNGTFRSPLGTSATRATAYLAVGGGDGMETVWNYGNENEIIISVYNNSFYKSNDAGRTWFGATSGLADIGENAPFITRLGNSKSQPEVVYAVGSSGVWKSVNFAGSWNLTPIPEEWILSASLDVEVSLADFNIVWAGGEMSEEGKIFVSTDAGASFTKVNNYSEVPLGNISGIATHPREESTAYLLFSFAGAPKILRTRDLGQSWTDISGFGTNEVSSNGFPDVAVHSLLVMPHNTDIIWAGTEIGIFESIENGESRGLLTGDFPSVSVWDMKVVDRLVVVGTHGRGIWTASIPELPDIVVAPVILSTGVNYSGNLVINAGLRAEYDSTLILVNGEKTKSLMETGIGDSVIVVDFNQPGECRVQISSYVNGKGYSSMPLNAEIFSPLGMIDKFSTEFTGLTVADSFSGNGFEIKTVLGFDQDDPALHSPHNYDTDTTYLITLLAPIRVSSEFPWIFYEDIAILEPGEPGSTYGEVNFYDYVVWEGTRDGVTWLALDDGYDARADGKWLDAYNNKRAGSPLMWKEHTLDLLEVFSAGDIIMVRVKFFSDPLSVGWGYAMNNLYIQTQRPVGLEDEYDLLKPQVYPNPFTGQVNIRFFNPQNSQVSVEILDMNGRQIDFIPLGFLVPGEHLIEWNTTVTKQGTYLMNVIHSRGIFSTRVIKD